MRKKSSPDVVDTKQQDDTNNLKIEYNYHTGDFRALGNNMQQLTTLSTLGRHLLKIANVTDPDVYDFLDDILIAILEIAGNQQNIDN